MSGVPIVTLTTDFGLDDSYVAQMKGALAAIAPDARVIDVSHAVPPGDVAAGAWMLETAHAAFPSGTVHVAVVDPGVGTARRALAARAGGHAFVGPDNGLLSRALRARGGAVVHEIVRVPDGPHPGGSATFHGRDLFAPVGAELANGRPLGELGPRCERWAEVAGPATGLRPGVLHEVPVAWIDRFGNVTLDLTAAEIERALGRPFGPGCPAAVLHGGTIVDRVLRTFGDAGDERPFLIRNSCDYLEIACRDRPADQALGLRRGSGVRVRIG